MVNLVLLVREAPNAGIVVKQMLLHPVPGQYFACCTYIINAAAVY